MELVINLGKRMPWGQLRLNAMAAGLDRAGRAFLSL
jgi:hypothetical protein